MEPIIFGLFPDFYEVANVLREHKKKLKSRGLNCAKTFLLRESSVEHMLSLTVCQDLDRDSLAFEMSNYKPYSLRAPPLRLLEQYYNIYINKFPNTNRRGLNFNHLTEADVELFISEMNHNKGCDKRVRVALGDCLRNYEFLNICTELGTFDLDHERFSINGASDWVSVPGDDIDKQLTLMDERMKNKDESNRDELGTSLLDMVIRKNNLLLSCLCVPRESQASEKYKKSYLRREKNHFGEMTEKQLSKLKKRRRIMKIKREADNGQPIGPESDPSNINEDVSNVNEDVTEDVVGPHSEDDANIMNVNDIFANEEVEGPHFEYAVDARKKTEKPVVSDLIEKRYQGP